MNIAVGSDHRGFEVIERIAHQLNDAGHAVEIISCPAEGGCDYPEPAFEVGSRVADGRAERGILVCGTGIGMSMAANKVHGIRAALVHDELTAELSRQHNDANVLCLSADLLGEHTIERIIETWLKAAFEGGRHARRVGKIMAIEGRPQA